MGGGEPVAPHSLRASDQFEVLKADIQMKLESLAFKETLLWNKNLVYQTSG